MKKIIIILILAVLTLTIGYFGYFSKQNLENKSSEEYSSLDDEYNLYVNNNLGFSIKIPKYVSYGYFECQRNKNDCEKYRKYLVLKQIEGTNKIGFYYKINGTNKEFFEGYFGEEVKEPGLLFFKIESQNEIEMNIQKLFGSGCKVEKIEISKNGKYKVPVVSGDLVACKYLRGLVIVNINKSETKMLISNFDGGQNAMFATDFSDPAKSNSGDYKIYDFEFSDNITLLEN